jgi:hypothetical protein
MAIVPLGGGYFIDTSKPGTYSDGTKTYQDPGTVKDTQSTTIAPTPATSGTGVSTPYSGSSFQNRMAVKIAAPSNLVTQEDSNASPEQITQELFEDLSLDEIMTMGRSETVLGMNITYQPIKNVASIYFQYNPKSILALAGVADEESQQIGIDISKHLIDSPIAIDPITGEIVIGFKNMNSSDRVEVEMISSGDIITTS